VAITIEHRLNTSKSAIALFTGVILWIIASFYSHIGIEEGLIEVGADIFSIIAFLLAAMSLVEILVHYKFFDVVRGQLYKFGLSEKKQFIALSIITFFLSAMLDNLTTTIVMIQIGRKFFKGNNMLLMAASIVIAANAGGAFSPIGDVTTIMLWLADKFTALEVIQQGFLPSLAILIGSLVLMYPKIDDAPYVTSDEIVSRLTRSEKLVVISVFASFSLPLIMNLIGLPPYFGMLLGLGSVWLIIDFFKSYTKQETHLDASIEDFIKKTDIPSLKFFMGILLAVSALGHIGLLEQLSHFVFTEDPSLSRMIFGNISLGFLSAVLDNVPLTAISMEILKTGDSSIWVLLALAVGTGGSMLIVGSAAGVVAMGMVKELTFEKYVKLATVPALVGYLLGMVVWYIQNMIT
jgi:Na+/H+ antiporter NhaD/arsenite permease-like protein